MGDPRRIKKKFDKPKHPWQLDRLEEERGILSNYGLKNKRELWRGETLLRGFRRHARRLLALHTPQARIEEKQLVERLKSLNLLRENATLDDALALKIEDLLNRRLQTLVFNKGFSSTAKQARQFVVHGHVTIGGRKITAPGYLVPRAEENEIGFTGPEPTKSAPKAEEVEAEGEKEGGPEGARNK